MNDSPVWPGEGLCFISPWGDPSYKSNLSPCRAKAIWIPEQLLGGLCASASHHEPCLVLRQLSPLPLSFSWTASQGSAFPCKDAHSKAAWIYSTQVARCYLSLLKSPGKKKTQKFKWSAVLMAKAQSFTTAVIGHLFQAYIQGLYKFQESIWFHFFIFESLANWMLEQPMPHPRAARGGGE